MATRVAKVLALTSTAALVGAICLWALASRIDCRSQQIGFGPRLYVTATRSGFDGRLLLFDDLKNGPHRGINAYHLINVSRPLPGIAVWSSSSGIIMAHPGWWTLDVSLFYPIGLFAIAPLVWLLRKRKRGGHGFPVCGDAAAG